jgi:hypothetical protein
MKWISLENEELNDDQDAKQNAESQCRKPSVAFLFVILHNSSFILFGEPMLALIDNYDSFTYNLVQYLGELGADIRVFRNDQIS